MVSAVTPGAVFPPLSAALPVPVQGSTHGGAYPVGTATFPVVVSQFGPQSTVFPWALASSKVSGGAEPPFGGSPAAPAPVAGVTPGTRPAITRLAASTASHRGKGRRCMARRSSRTNRTHEGHPVGWGRWLAERSHGPNDSNCSRSHGT